MKLRIICQETDGSATVQLGEPAITRYKTFDVEAPEDLAVWLDSGGGSYIERSIKGVERLPRSHPSPDHPLPLIESLIEENEAALLDIPEWDLANRQLLEAQIAILRDHFRPVLEGPRP